MDDFQLTTGQITSLKALHRLQRDRRKADRVKAVVLLGTGWTVAEVAEALLVDEKTIRLWYEKYLRGGENELLILCHAGKEPLLSEDQRQELARHLDETTYLSRQQGGRPSYREDVRSEIFPDRCQGTSSSARFRLQKTEARSRKTRSGEAGGFSGRIRKTP